MFNLDPDLTQNTRARYKRRKKLKYWKKEKPQSYRISWIQSKRNCSWRMGCHANYQTNKSVGSKKKTSSEEVIKLFHSASHQRERAAGVCLHSQQMLQFEIARSKHEFVRFSPGWSLWDSSPLTLEVLTLCCTRPAAESMPCATEAEWNVSLSSSSQLCNFHLRATFGDEGGTWSWATWAFLSSVSGGPSLSLCQQTLCSSSTSWREMHKDPGQNLITSAPRNQGPEDVYIWTAYG